MLHPLTELPCTPSLALLHTYGTSAASAWTSSAALLNTRLFVCVVNVMVETGKWFVGGLAVAAVGGGRDARRDAFFVAVELVPVGTHKWHGL